MKLRRSLNPFNTYKEYINSWLWKEKTEEMKRIDRICKECGSKHFLQIHHITYENLGNEKKRDLILLCNECHNKKHKRG